MLVAILRDDFDGRERVFGIERVKRISVFLFFFIFRKGFCVRGRVAVSVDFVGESRERI